MSGGGAINPPTLDYATPHSASRRGKGFLSVCASVALPGLGQFITGYRWRGIIWFMLWLAIGAIGVIALAVPVLVPALLIVIPIVFAAHIWMWIDAYRCGRRSRLKLLGSPLLRYVSGVAILALVWFVAPDRRLAVLIRDHLVEAFVIPTNSMAPTLLPGDRFLCHKKCAFERWSIVVVEPPDRPSERYARRIVGLPGETIEIVGGQIRVNGRDLPAPPFLGRYVTSIGTGYRLTNPGVEGNPINLRGNEHYVLGDNTLVAVDSRVWNIAYPDHQLGAVPRDRIKGTVTYIYWPPSRWRRF